MDPIRKIHELIRGMTPEQKTHLLQIVVGELDDRVPGIESRPEVCGGDPCVVRTRIPVWLLERLRRQGATDAQLLDMYPSLRPDDLHHAWAYVSTHQAEIERQIHAQETA